MSQFWKEAWKDTSGLFIFDRYSSFRLACEHRKVNNRRITQLSTEELLEHPRKYYDKEKRTLIFID